MPGSEARPAIRGFGEGFRVSRRAALAALVVPLSAAFLTPRAGRAQESTPPSPRPPAWNASDPRLSWSPPVI